MEKERSSFSGSIGFVLAAAGSADGSTVGAGPALVISMIIAAIACVFSALCYSEFATMIPVAAAISARPIRNEAMVSNFPCP